MLIDLICDRKAGQPYNAKKFYDAVTSYLDTFPCYIGVARALDGGTEADVITELCDYIKSQGYNLDLCDYISSVKWLEDDEPKDDKSQNTEQRSVWLRIGVTVSGTTEEIEALFNEDAKANEVLRKLLVNKQYEFDGDAYIPEYCVESYNEEYHTDHGLGDYEFNL